MTLEQLSKQMSNQEFELHLALSMVKQDECPHCGVEPRDMNEFGVVSLRCPICKADYSRLRHYPSGLMDDTYREDKKKG